MVQGGGQKSARRRRICSRHPATDGCSAKPFSTGLISLPRPLCAPGVITQRHCDRACAMARGAIPRAEERGALPAELLCCCGRRVARQLSPRPPRACACGCGCECGRVDVRPSSASSPPPSPPPMKPTTRPGRMAASVALALAFTHA
jgi:hypothetical protein